MRVVNLLDWNVSTRLWLGFGFLIFILVLCAIVPYILIHQADEDLSEAVDVQVPLEQAVLRMKASAAETTQAVLDYSRDNDPAELEAAHDAETLFEAASADFVELADTDEVEQLGRELTQVYEEFAKSRYEIVALVDRQYSELGHFREDIEAIGALADEKLLSAIEITTQDAAEKMKGALGMKLAAVEVDGAVTAYVREPAPVLEQALSDAQADFETSAELYRATGLSSYEESWLSEIVKDFSATVSKGNELLATTDSLQALLAQLEEDHVDISTYLDDRIGPLIQGGALEASDDSQSALDAAAILILTLGIVGILVGGISVLAISRRFHRSVHGLQRGAQAVAEGKLDHRFDVDTKDEFGQVGFGLNQMLQNLGRSRAALGESEEAAWALLDASTDSIILTDAKGIILASNEVAAHRLGKSLEQMIDESFYDVLPADLMASRKAQIAEVIRSKKPLHFEDEREGMILDTRIFPVLNEKGNVSRIAIFASDITTRKWVEEVTERLARRNELILQAAGEGIYGLDAEGKTTFVNPAAARMLGYKPEDLIGQRHHELVHHSKPDGKPYPHQQCPIYAAFNDGAIHHSEGDEVFWRKDGTCFPVDYTSTPILEDGKIVGAVVTFRDITDRKRIDDAMRQSEEKYRSIFDNAANLIISVDSEGDIIDCNGRAETVLGYKPDEIIGHNVVEIIHPDQRAQIQECLKEVLDKGFQYNRRYSMVQKDGKMIEVNMNAAAAKDAEGEYLRTICMVDMISGGSQG